MAEALRQQWEDGGQRQLFDFDPLVQTVRGVLRLRRNETLPAPIKHVAVYGIGQTGELFSTKFADIDGLQVSGFVKNPDKRASLTQRIPNVQFTSNFESLMAPQNKPQVIILAIPNPTGDALKQIAATVDRPTTIVLTQNGIGVVDEALQAFKDKPVNIIRGSLHTTVDYKSDGRGIEFDPNNLRIDLAYVKGDRNALKSVRTVFQKAGFKARLYSDYRKMELKKLFLNLFGTTGVITGLGPSETFNDPVLFSYELSAAVDRFRILEKEHVRLNLFLTSIFKLLSYFYDKNVPVPENVQMFARKHIAAYVAHLRNNFEPATARKIRQDKPTESEWYHRPMIDLGEKHGLKSPVDEAIAQAVKEHEKHEIDLKTVYARSHEDKVAFLRNRVESEKAA